MSYRNLTKTAAMHPCTQPSLFYIKPTVTDIMTVTPHTVMLTKPQLQLTFCQSS